MLSKDITLQIFSADR